MFTREQCLERLRAQVAAGRPTMMNTSMPRFRVPSWHFSRGNKAVCWKMEKDMWLGISSMADVL